MKKTLKNFVILLIILLNTNQNIAQDKIEWGGTDEHKLMGLFTVWSEAKYAFPFFNQIPEVDWDSKVQEYIPKVLTSKDIVTYYDLLMEFSAFLKDGHTAVNPPWGPFKPGFDYSPLELEVLENRFIITRVGETDEMKMQNVFPGLEVVEVDNQKIQNYFDDNVLGYNSRGTSQANEVINLWPLLRGKKDSKVNLKVKLIDKTTREIEVTRNLKLGDGSKFYCEMFNWYMIDPVLESKILPDGKLYIKISNFEDKDLIPQFQKLLEELDESVIEGMIIDLRHNPGGESSIAETVISMLIDKKISSSVWHVPHYIAANRAWGKDQVWTEFHDTISPIDGKKYLGPLVILTGGGTYSSAEDFIIPLHYSKRAILVGGKTAGSSGNPLRVQLPGGVNFRVVTVKMIYPDGKEYIGIGIKPDIEVSPTQLDII